jgi:hypothetical protein
MAQPESDFELLRALPDAETIRYRLEENRRESRLLRRLLKIAADKERPAKQNREGAQ